MLVASCFVVFKSIFVRSLASRITLYRFFPFLLSFTLTEDSSQRRVSRGQNPSWKGAAQEFGSNSASAGPRL